MGRMMGLEPTAFGATIRRSNQLSYIRRVAAKLQKQKAITILVSLQFHAMNRGDYT
jgi:hypothetical protein